MSKPDTPAASRAATLPEPAFRIKWLRGTRFVVEPVSIKPYGDTDCYTEDQMRAALEAAQPASPAPLTDAEGRYRSTCSDGSRCLGGCLAKESCHLDASAALASPQVAPAPEPIAHLKACGGLHAWMSYRTCSPDDPNAIPVYEAAAPVQVAPAGWQSRMQMGGKWTSWKECVAPENESEREVMLGGKVAYQFRPFFTAPMPTPAAADDARDAAKTPEVDCAACLGSGDVNYLAPEWPEKTIRCEKCGGTGRAAAKPTEPTLPTQGDAK